MLNKERKEKKRINYFRLILSVTLLFLLVFISIYVRKNYQSIKETFYTMTHHTSFPGKTKINVLILGIDGNIEPSRTDTLILTNLDLKSYKAKLVSIPRDMYVNIPGKGFDKINAAHFIGGNELTIKTVEKFLDVPIDYYVLLNFKGFKKTIDLLGGVNIYVEKRMRYIDRAGHLYINLKKGQQRLNGEQAMGYVRFRHDAWGDITRIERQQKFISALCEEVLKPQVLLKIPSIIYQIIENVETDLNISQILELTDILRKVKKLDIEKATIPGVPFSKRGISYLRADEEEKKKIVQKFFKEKEDKENKVGENNK